MKLQDALFNWLQMKIVSDARPDDNAAQETLAFFAEILHEDHKVGEVYIAEMDDWQIQVDYEWDGVTHHVKFDRELAEQLLKDINANPKYN